MTFIPFASSAWAIIAPRPLPPPVITATSPGTLNKLAASIFEELEDISGSRQVEFVVDMLLASQDLTCEVSVRSSSGILKVEKA